MSRIYVSPSRQFSNVGSYPAGTSEGYWMTDLAKRVMSKLTPHGHVVRVGETSSASNQVKDANAWGYDIYVALHTNAGGGQGTTVYQNPNSALSKELAAALIKYVAPFSVGVRKQKFYDGMGFVEVNSTRGRSVLIELEFHDNPLGASHIINNLDGYASAIANGILDVVGRKASAPHIAVPTPTALPQVGIYLVHTTRDDAITMAATAISTGRAAWVVSAAANFDGALNHTDALNYITRWGSNVDKKFQGMRKTHAVLAVHADVAWGDANIRDKARALGKAATDVYPTGRTTNGYRGFTDALATMLEDGLDVKAVFGEPDKVVAPTPTPTPTGKTVAQLADEVLAGKHGTGDARKRSLGSRYAEVQAEVNRRLGVGTAAPAKTIAQLADEVLAGKHGTGEARKKSLGSRYAAVQAEVNRRLSKK